MHLQHLQQTNTKLKKKTTKTGSTLPLSYVHSKHTYTHFSGFPCRDLWRKTHFNLIQESFNKILFPKICIIWHKISLMLSLMFLIRPRPNSVNWEWFKYIFGFFGFFFSFYSTLPLLHVFKSLTTKEMHQVLSLL